MLRALACSSLLLILVACSVSDPISRSSDVELPERTVDPVVPSRLSDAAAPSVLDVAPGARDAAACDAPDALSALDVPDAAADAPDAASCPPTLGHCLTNMATRCFETPDDETAQCAQTGMPQGWSLGACDPARSSGACLLGCVLTYYYPLGGGQPSDASRSGVRSDCESVGGTYVAAN